MPSSAVTRELLAGYQGLHISGVCTAVRFVDDAQNHCAHFVNHVLGITASLTCGKLLGRAGASANIRVHETFALCPEVGRFEDRPPEPCLAFLIQRNQIDLGARRMNNVPKKHIGIFCEGEVWHYSNTQHRVVRQTPEAFAQHFAGDGFALFFGTFPVGARALAVASSGSEAAPHRSSAAIEALPELRRAQRDSPHVAVWQQFLIVRQLLSGPNIRTLLDGNFGDATEEATEAFQVSARLPVTGVVDSATYRTAIEQGYIPHTGARPRKALTQVTEHMTVAAVDALHRLGPSHFFYTEEALSVDGRIIIARLEPHKHASGTQLRFWHRGITLYAAAEDDVLNPAPPLSPAPSLPSPSPAIAHAGMDTSVYPGDSVMAQLKANTNLVWTGFYLGPAPSHAGTSWMGKRRALRDQGWGLAALYLGQQESGLGSHHVSREQGEADGQHAVVLGKKAEFPPGAVLYLDIELGGPLSATMRDYLQRWCQHVRAGGYVPGAYLSHTSAASARQAVPGLELWVFRVRKTDVGVHKAPPFRTAPPNESGVSDALAWQWAQNCRIPKLGGGEQLVDLNMSSTPDPSRV